MEVAGREKPLTGVAESSLFHIIDIAARMVVTARQGWGAVQDGGSVALWLMEAED